MAVSRILIVLVGCSVLLISPVERFSLLSFSWSGHASLKRGDVFRDRLKSGSEGPEMVLIPGGKFRMGDIQAVGGKDEQPVHEVHIARRFAISKFEITFDQYDEFARATGRKLPGR